MPLNRAFAGVTAVVLATALTTAAAATPKVNKGRVTAKSDYGNGTVTAPVRMARHGLQVRLPGGLWYYCEVSCIDTLRREALDFWETRSEEGGDNDFD
ncbi:MAG: hypothetical protein MPJ78_03280 [Hyphomicrobiaceae bacterium]|nr:hypothetical protein [Hyphomicrobiaceae bacterium]